MQLGSNRFLFAIILSCFSVGLFSCTASRSTQTSTVSNNRRPKFINDISIRPESNHHNKESRIKNITALPKEENAHLATDLNYSYKTNPEAATNLQYTYAQKLNIPIEQANDISIYKEIDHWYGVPYMMGGNTENGVDCSAFSKIFFSDLYDLDIPRTAQEQYNQSTSLEDKTALSKGDLVFFGSSKHNITHVGVYISNNKFVHASTSHGVMISDLDDKYWHRKFVSAGRYNGVDSK